MKNNKLVGLRGNFLAFLTFDFSTDQERIARWFTNYHLKRKANYPEWPYLSTRHIAVNRFWQLSVLHFCSLYITASFVIVLLFPNSIPNNLAFFFVWAFLCYGILYISLYRNVFFHFFLPNLDLVIFRTEGKDKVRLEKCKQEQLSTRSLVLLYYILDKCAGINYLTPSDKSASLLLKIFGVSQKGLKNELDLLFKKEKRVKIEQRKQTEIAKSFEEVYAILEEMQFPKGVQMLKELEIRFNRPE